VPIRFGSDALGGAVNLATSLEERSSLNQNVLDACGRGDLGRIEIYKVRSDASAELQFDTSRGDIRIMTELPPAEECGDHCVRRFFEGQRGRIDVQLRLLRRLVGTIDPREVLELPGAGLLI